MGLGVGLLEEGQPGLLRVLALCKVESGAVGLVDSAVGFLGADAFKVIEDDTVEVAFVVIWLCEI